MKMISVMGSPCSGKTSVSCQLARVLAKGGKRVLIVFLDDQNPPFSYLIPSNEIKKEQVLSLGSLLSDYDITQQKIWKSACPVMDDKAALLGYLKSDAADTYPQLTEYCIDSFLNQVQQVDVDIVIWDTSNMSNMLHSRIMALNPYTISVLRAVPKDLSWAIRNNGFDADTIVLNAVTRGQDVSIPEIPSSKICCLPWSDKLNFNMNSMDAFGQVDRKYSKAISKLIDRSI